MKVKVFIILFAMQSAWSAVPSAGEFYSDLERHLRSLPTLEVSYHARGPAFGEAGMDGQMTWLRPDYFLHETAEWIHCDTRAEQWRYLKLQNTLIRETPQGRSDWLPESVLLDASVDLRPRFLEESENGGRVLTLSSDDPTSPGEVFMRFDQGSSFPQEIEFLGADGTQTVYRITQWEENGIIDSSRFQPPEVPAENLIDFRSAGN
jgi:hypothetical protein